ncbi:MAG: tRNA (guanosine(37)-N1)-methyltransferase TrmD [Candidatus Spechtbacteria bacterium]|nr:tRNA (guanosine(37)-N1)-methyltransferase TrmD [Candidatus Spechtbacteria bacterium]
MITFDILTIFPEMFSCYFDSSMLGRAQKKKLIKIRVHNLRDFTKDKHKITDDLAYGGISGMVMKVEPIYRAVQKLKIKGGLTALRKKSRVILLSAKGKVLTQEKVRRFAKYDQIILIAGHYKGVDERVAKHIADEELSVGEYVITGGEVPAMIVVDAVSRMIKGVIGDEASKEGESFSILGRSGRPRERVKHEHGVYTRPAVFSPKKGVRWEVPEVLLSGHHAKIEEWREAQRNKA